MNNKLYKIIMVILVLFVMPVVLGVIVAKAVADHNGILLIIVFASLVILSLVSSVIRFIKYKQSKE